MKNPNADGRIVWDTATNQEILYSRELEAYVHEACGRGHAPHHTYEHASLNQRDTNYYASERCYWCAALFVSTAIHPTPAQEFQQHFL